MGIRAIPARYAGYHFRSRLEARWAVLLDFLAIEWRYEDEGYEISPGVRYLPDFFLPRQNIFIEVKPKPDSIDWQLMFDCVDFGFGLPIGDETGHLVIVTQPDSLRPYHPALRHYKGVAVDTAIFAPGAVLVQRGPRGIICGLPGQVEEESRPFFNPVTPSVVQERIRWWTDAVSAARSARFEHGHRGAS